MLILADDLENDRKGELMVTPSDSDIKRKINGKDTATTHQENSCMLKEPSLEFELGIMTNHCEVDSLRFSMNLNRVVRPSTWQAI